MAPTVPLGKPLQLTDAELDALAVITPEDIQRAKALWSQAAPEQFKDLLNPILLDVTEEG
jgi:hypothetical protein